MQLPKNELEDAMMKSSRAVEKTEYESILKRVIERDRIDSTRDVAPLKAAEDAVVLDSDQLNEDQVFERVLALVK